MRRAAAAFLALHLAALPSTAETDGEVLFDPATGFRIARYRAAVVEPPAGVTRVTIEGVDRLIARNAVLIDVMPSDGGGLDRSTGQWRMATARDNIAGSVWLPDVGKGALDAVLEHYFRGNLERLTGGDMARALVVYCFADCWMAWNAAKRAVSYGYSAVYWYPEGSDGFRDHDRPLVPATPVPVRVD